MTYSKGKVIEHRYRDGRGWQLRLIEDDGGHLDLDLGHERDGWTGKLAHVALREALAARRDSLAPPKQDCPRGVAG